MIRYLRLIVASCLIGIAFGFFLELLDRVDMTAFRTFDFAVRGGIVGALFWGFEIFFVGGTGQERLHGMSYGQRMTVRIVAYIVLIEIGLFVGQVLFAPDDPFGLLPILKRL